MSLPLTFKGHSTRDLINQWERVCGGTADGSGDCTAADMNEFLMIYKLCPISWLSEPDYEEAHKKADALLEELMGRKIITVGVPIIDDEE